MSTPGFTSQEARRLLGSKDRVLVVAHPFSPVRPPKPGSVLVVCGAMASDDDSQLVLITEEHVPCQA